MVTRLDIFNMALSLINQKNISTIDEKSIPAEKAKLFYPEVLKRLIESYEWSFCSYSKVFNGEPSTSINIKGEHLPYDNTYLYKYSLPEKGIKFGEDIKTLSEQTSLTQGTYRSPCVLNARNQNMRKPYIMEYNSIFADLDRLFLKVIFLQEDESSYSSSFTWALIYSLAATLTKVLIDSASYAQLMDAKAKESELDAIAEDQRKFPTEFVRH